MKEVKDLEDNNIIQLFYKRSEEAIIELKSKYENKLFTISYNILKNKMDVEECVNDTYFAAWETIPPQNPEPLLAYLIRIVRNISIKKYHKNSAKKRNSHYDVALEELRTVFQIKNLWKKIMKQKS